ncbi:hypothetical protein ACF0H5_006981 [Mactra antiquata]
MSRIIANCFSYFMVKRSMKCKIFFFVIVISLTSVWMVLDLNGARQNDITIRASTEVDLSHYFPAGVEAYVDFPVNNEKTFRNNQRIPKIIHQTWSESAIPATFKDNVISFTKFNPEYEYYLWTDKGARDLIAKKHKELLKTFDNYVEPVRKSDMLRYVALYEYGGVYADLDTVCLRNLDRVLNKYSCVFTPEPFEHATLFYNTEFMVTNSIMFCSAKHPYMKQLMNTLPSFSHFSVDIDSTGPLLQTYLLSAYLRALHARNITDEHDESVYIPSDVYFQSEIDIKRFKEFRTYCNNFDHLNYIGKQGCAAFAKRGMVRRRQSPYTYTKHAFYHTRSIWLPRGTIEIKQVVPYVTVF